MALDPGFLLGLAKLVLEPLFALVVNGSLERDLTCELVADLMQQVLQEESPRLCQQQTFLSPRPELQSVLVVYHCYFLQRVIQLAQVDQPVGLHMLA